ncbi:unnamed protein product (macronuclear) [Paramecium tetraurelia]|uniref:Uncharacterized protein n=1 Tax=Paramecium tetraurelia TaxID=5888 RepID=A0C1G9_PARTE|nr:uncharacterized protein GSPATT00034112001 [Paramecium tetraurelia]CAK64636.1 unnamed protein product [Paramecium tetraurelia]|eukprot:XP_001432033.1 hypothetical protein (macronuclear) [Paramecium tetraurelia strain d4-2]
MTYSKGTIIGNLSLIYICYILPQLQSSSICFEIFKLRIHLRSVLILQIVICNLIGSKLEAEDVSGMNLNRAQLFNCKWNNIKIPELNKLEGQYSGASSICISPDSNTLVTGYSNGSICLWDLKTVQQKAKLDAHNSCVSSFCFSPYGTILASSNYYETIRLWCTKTRKSIWYFLMLFSKWHYIRVGYKQCLFSVLLSPDSTTLASGSADQSIRICDVKIREQTVKQDGHSDSANSICFSSDATILATCSYDASIRILDVNTGQQKAKLNGHINSINSVCFSPNVNILQLVLQITLSIYISDQT